MMRAISVECREGKADGAGSVGSAKVATVFPEASASSSPPDANPQPVSVGQSAH